MLVETPEAVVPFGEYFRPIKEWLFMLTVWASETGIPDGLEMLGCAGILGGGSFWLDLGGSAGGACEFTFSQACKLFATPFTTTGDSERIWLASGITMVGC